MSISVVTPPAAAALVAVANPSHSCARLVDVHVGVHHAGQQHLVVGQVGDAGRPVPAVPGADS